jgi:wyosine [tRNA(Phe)-imidazoG37] synthetase (radical SAM superfamily)
MDLKIGDSAYHYLFGPVPSRRFGRSLGVDVTPFKTCSFDCLFCQCGCTTRRTAERGEFVPFEKVCAELEQWLAEDGRADCITFAGSGEPTLYSRLGELIRFIKEKTDLPVTVLSNGALLHRVSVRDDLLQADTVKASLSAWDDDSFRTIHRPANGLTYEQLLAGIRDFRKVFKGSFYLEVFVMEGINSDPEQVRRIAAAAAQIHPDKIQLNTAVRPAAESSVHPVSIEKLEALSALFTPQAEIIASFNAPAPSGGEADLPQLLALLRRHPATAGQLAAASGASTEAIETVLAARIASGEVQTETRPDGLYYTYR